MSQSEIILKISASDLSVSSKPGVSTKQISVSRISGIETLKTEISFVQDLRPCPAIPVMPVTISMNYFTRSVGQSKKEGFTNGALPRACWAHYARWQKYLRSLRHKTGKKHTQQPRRQKTNHPFSLVDGALRRGVSGHFVPLIPQADASICGTFDPGRMYNLH